MSARTPLSAVLLVGALALSLAGCSGDSSPPAEQTQVGPLEELFNSIYGEWSTEAADAEMMAMEELIAQCMSEQGFEYTPVDYSAAEPGSAPDAEYGTREFAEEYGYGATTNPWRTDDPLPEDEWVDPNVEYVESMSPAEQEAYWAALHGDPSYPEDPNGDWEYNWEEAGCQGWAQNEVYQDQNAFEDERFLALQPEIEAMWSAIMEDPRLSRLERNWASCMADAGYPDLTSVEDAPNAIYEEVNAIWAEVWATLPADPTESDYDAAEQAAQARLSSVTEREIAMAVADVTCRERVDYDGVQREVSFDHQQQFYDTHREELDAWANDYRPDYQPD